MVFSKNFLLLTAFLFHICAAVFSIGYHHCDELFQVFEFAGYKLGINSANNLPWEFHEQMRSGIQPLIVYSVTKVFHSFSISNPFTIALFLRSLQAALSFMAIVSLLNVLEKEVFIAKLNRWLWAFSLFFWCLPYFHARFSSENFSSTLFLFGLVIVLKNLNNKSAILSYLFAGFLFGLSFLCRFQISFFILGLFGWLLFIQKTQLKAMLAVFFGFVLALGVGLLIDQWMYGAITFTWWNYLELNLFKNKASVYGTESIYFYLQEGLLQLIPPFSLIIIFSCFAFWKNNKRHVITWITIPFILLHFFVGHKELRFLFPVLNFLPFMVILYFQSIIDNTHNFILFFKRQGFLYFAIGVNIILLLIFTFKPADNISHSLKIIYEKVEGLNPILLYEGNAPYNNEGSLNYFRNNSIQLVHLNTDTLLTDDSKNMYYFSEKYNESEFITKGNKKFELIYCSIPPWILKINFNGWADRVFAFSIYKRTK